MKSLGDKHEDKALNFLQAEGLRLVERNFASKYGEIDIIAIEDRQLVFVEVRCRSNRHFNSAAGSVDWRKQQRIIKTAQLFLQSHRDLANLSCRFDVIAFEPPQSTTDSRVRWIRGAFTA
ncbi:MAG: putative endonuclease [Halioglobus sp.]|jgi:putative endonuclease